MQSFIFFGCWNYIDLTVEVPPRDKVLRMIKENSSDIESIIIAGDNWYPTKNTEIETETETKTKKYLKTVLKSGFELLSAIDKKVYLAIGNHDIKQIPDTHPCFLLEKQLNLLKKHIRNGNLIYPSIKYQLSNSPRLSSDRSTFLSKIEREPIIQVIDGNHFLFIDTDILQEDYTIYLDKIIKIIGDEYSIKDKTIEKTKLLFIVGHDPFFVCRKKEDKTVYKTFIKKTEEFITNLKNYNVIYLCADTHNFQIGILNDTIPMIIGGTGGASLDELCFHDKNKKNIINDSNSYYYYNVKEYGYLKITPVNNINVTVIFKSLENEYTYEINLKEKSIKLITKSIYYAKIKKDFNKEYIYIE